MKKLLALVTIVLIATTLKAQTNPVTWTFTAKSLGDKKYEIHMTANLQNGWHLYSQSQPDDAVALPTTFTINSNPLVKLDGKIKEVGKMQKFHDERLSISANQYSTTVDFVQVVKLTANVKTNLTGKVEYQTCDDKKCLPQKTVSFSIAIK